MSQHYAFADDATVVYCYETEDNEQVRTFDGDQEPWSDYCTGCRELLDTPLPLIHHMWDGREDWNCNGQIAEKADDGDTCLGCGFSSEYETPEATAGAYGESARRDAEREYDFGRHL